MLLHLLRKTFLSYCSDPLMSSDHASPIPIVEWEKTSMYTPPIIAERMKETRKKCDMKFHPAPKTSPIYEEMNLVGGTRCNNHFPNIYGHESESRASGTHVKIISLCHNFQPHLVRKRNLVKCNMYVRPENCSNFYI